MRLNAHCKHAGLAELLPSVFDTFDAFFVTTKLVVHSKSYSAKLHALESVSCSLEPGWNVFRTEPLV